jgi:hypothetical protein
MKLVNDPKKIRPNWSRRFDKRRSGHKNLRTRMFELVQQTFLAKKLLESLLISTLDKAINNKGTFLQGSTKPLFTTQNRLETS